MVDGETADAQKMKHIWLIIGPSGCGKSTVANHLREVYSLPYVEGDDACAPSAT